MTPKKKPVEKQNISKKKFISPAGQSIPPMNSSIYFNTECSELYKVYDAISGHYFYEHERSNNMNSWLTHQLTIIAGFLTVLFIFSIQNLHELKSIFDNILLRNNDKDDLITYSFFVFFIIYLIITIIASLRILRCMYKPDRGNDYLEYEPQALPYFIQDQIHMRNLIILMIQELWQILSNNNSANNKVLRIIMTNTKLLFYDAIAMFAFMSFYIIIEIEGL